MSDYSFSIRDNLSPIQLVWEDEVADTGLIGEMPMLRSRQKQEDLEFEFAVYASQLDMLDMVERKLKWESVFTSM